MSVRLFSPEEIAEQERRHIKLIKIVGKCNRKMWARNVGVSMSYLSEMVRGVRPTTPKAVGEAMKNKYGVHIRTPKDLIIQENRRKRLLKMMEGFTQKKWAKKVGLHQHTIGRMTRGESIVSDQALNIKREGI